MTDQYSNYLNYQQQPQQHQPIHHSNLTLQQQQLQQQQFILQQQRLQQQQVQQNVNNFSNLQQSSHNQPIGVNQQQLPNPELTSSTSIYLALLGLAESFQQNNQIKLCIHCLESILTLKNQDMPILTNFHMQLKTRLNLCRLYLKHTTNTNQYINAHLEKSMILVQNLNANDEYKYEATYTIYRIFQKQKEFHIQLKQSSAQIDQSQLVSLYNLDLIRNSLETSSVFPVWHIRLLFLIGNILIMDRDFTSAANYLSMGIDYCATNRISYTHILFILSKGLIHLLQRNPSDLQTTMQPCAALIESYNTQNVHQIELLKVFFLILQVTYFIQCGQMKSVRNTLKSLQQFIQSLANKPEDQSDHVLISKNPLENFYWMTKDHLGILVYLLTIIHSIQTGCFDKAQKFTDKALLNLQKIKLKEQIFSQNSSTSWASNKNGCTFITNKLHYMLLENQIRCLIAMGNRVQALKHVGDLFHLCDQDSRIMHYHSPQLHCLLGIYSLSVNNKDTALDQFNQCLKSTTDTDLWLYSAMSLALCQLTAFSSSPQNTNIKNQLLNIIDNVLPEKIQTQNTSLTSFSHFFKALKYYLNSNYQQAQESIREAILLSNSEELSNITANSFLFMGHMNFLTNQYQDSFNMLTNGVDLADKMPDINLRIYGSSMLRDLYKYFNDPREAETSKKLSDLEQINSTDYFEAIKMPQHNLINWNSNVLPTQILASIQHYQNSLAVSIPTSNQTASNSPNFNSPAQQPQSYQVHNQLQQIHHQQSPQQRVISAQFGHQQQLMGGNNKQDFSPNTQVSYTYQQQHMNQMHQQSPQQSYGHHQQHSPQIQQHVMHQQHYLIQQQQQQILNQQNQMQQHQHRNQF